MDELLSQARFDSHGSFTMDPLKAIATMAQAQLPGRTYWQLKLVQAAVASGAPALRIGPALMTFRPQESWSLEVIEADLLQPHPSPTRALYHLKQALWNVAFSQKLDFTLELSEESEALVYRAGKFERRPTRPEAGLRLTVHYPPDPNYLSEALARAYVCPIPLTLDGRRIDSLATDDPPVHLESLPGSEEVRLSLLVTQNRKLEPNYLHWIQDGIILEREELAMGKTQLRCDLYLSARQVATDAAGVKLVHDEVYQARRVEAHEQLWAAIEQIRVKPPAPFRKLPAQIVVGGVCLVAGLFSPPLVLPVGMLGMVTISAFEGEHARKNRTSDMESLKASARAARALWIDTSATASPDTEGT